jgi:hypothetical protein
MTPDELVSKIKKKIHDRKNVVSYTFRTLRDRFHSLIEGERLYG